MGVLIKRTPRQLAAHLPRYLALFLLLFATVAVISGMFDTSYSVMAILDAIPETYNVEDGHFVTATELTGEDMDAVEDAGVSLYKLFYKDAKATGFDKGTEVRVYTVRDQVNLADYHAGGAPTSADEIALSTIFCNLHGLAVGDAVEIGGRTFTISGLVDLPEYQAVFKSNTDFMFDNQTFAVALATESGFDAIDATTINCYSWQTDEPLDKTESADLGKDIVKALAKRGVAVSSLVDSYSNQGLNYVADDTEGDSMSTTVFGYIMVAVLAFVFVIMTRSTIEEESGTIGALLASGYRRRELFSHYMVLPTLIGLVACSLGYAAGIYGVTNYMQEVYYNSYNLPPYHHVFTWSTFLFTAVLPFVLLVAITALGLLWSLRATPLSFLRHEAVGRHGTFSLPLPDALPFASRFRIRLFARNLGNFATLFVGILFGTLLTLFGICSMQVVQNYANELADTLPSDYFTLVNPTLASMDDIEEERVTVSSLELPREMGGAMEEVSAYGISDDSTYWKNLGLEDDGFVAGVGLVEKCGLTVGEKVSFTLPSSDDTATVTLTGVYGSESNTNAYFQRTYLNELLDKDADYFNAYASDEELDLSTGVVISTMTPETMQKIADQLEDSMGGLMNLMLYAAIIVDLLLMFLLTSTVLDRSATSVARFYVFGYRSYEVRRLFIRPVTIGVLVSLVISVPINVWFLKYVVRWMFSEYNGNFSLVLPPSSIAVTIAIGIGCYLIVAAIHTMRIRREDFSVALKAAE